MPPKVRFPEIGQLDWSGSLQADPVVPSFIIFFLRRPLCDYRWFQLYLGSGQCNALKRAGSSFCENVKKHVFLRIQKRSLSVSDVCLWRPSPETMFQIHEARKHLWPVKMPFGLFCYKSRQTNKHTNKQTNTSLFGSVALT